MPQPIVLGDTSGLARGIEGAGSALASALQQRNQQKTYEGYGTTLGGILRSLGPNPSANDYLSAFNQALASGVPADYLAKVFPAYSPAIQAGFREVKPPAPPKPSKFQETVEAESAKDYIKSKEQVEATKQLLNTVDQMRELSKDFRGITGTIGAATGLNESATTFDQLALNVMKQSFEILNPRGSLPQNKVELVRKQYTPNSTDTQIKINGKLAAVQTMAEQALEAKQKRIALYEKYQGAIPPEEERRLNQEIDTQNEKFLDEMIANSKGENTQAVTELPKEAKRGTVALDVATGQKYIFNGSTWEKQ